MASTSGKGRRQSVNGVTLYLDDSGRGFPLLLLHGGLMDHQSWGNQISVFAKYFRVLAPDTRGHGRSTDSDEPYSYSLFADDFSQLLDRLGIAQADVVGFSDGACAGLTLAMTHPAVVRRLVVAGTTYNVRCYPPGTTDQFASLTSEDLHRNVTPAFAEILTKAERLYPSPQTWHAFVGKVVRDMWTREPNFTFEQLSSITAHTLVLYARHEPYYSWNDAQEMARAMPHAQLSVIPGASHTSPQENAVAFNESVLTFLGVPLSG